MTVERRVDDGVDLVVATVHRAEPFRLDPADNRPAAAIHVASDIPPGGDHDDGYRLFEADAKAIHDALVHACPGGTLDALFALMAAERATAYVVRTPYRDHGDLLRGLVDEVRALVEVFGGDATRPAARVDQDGDEDVVEAVIYCGGCDHPAHPDGTCPLVLPDGCGCRWGIEP